MKHFIAMLFFTLIVSSLSFAQKDTVVVDEYYTTGQEGTLNVAVQAAINAGTLSNTVFKLKPYGTYVLTGSIVTPQGAVLEICADTPGNTQEAAPPMICWTADQAPSKTYMFDVAGEVKMKNVWLLWADVGGTRYISTIRVGDSASVAGGRCEFNNIIFDYVQQNSSGAIQPFATHFVGKFNGCYFRNCTDDHFRYYSRAVSVPYAATGLHIDTLAFENCTFANIGYVYMQEGNVYGDNIHFNHCTFYNVVMHTLESGWWWRMNVTNSLFINTWMYGYLPGASDGINGGTISIAPIDSSSLSDGFGFDVPFTEADRHILFANNNYYIEQWLVDWMGYGTNGNPYSQAKHKQRLDDEIPLPQPMFNDVTKAFFDSTDADGNKIWPYINKADLDSIDPGFINPPINQDSLETFLYYKWDTNADMAWAWNPQNSYNQIWPLEESLAYTNEELKTAAMGEFPLGDLRWWPEQYALWKAQEDAEHKYITNWLETGSIVGVKEITGSIPSKYELNQNYPNPFNPTTEIEYSISKSGNISLKVYNSLGQEIATIFSGNQNAGKYVATFNGAGLASGVYFYRLQADGVSLTKKFVLMK